MTERELILTGIGGQDGSLLWWLFLTSLFSATDVNALGWWEILSKPSLATFQNYQEIWDNQSIRSAFWKTVWISLGGTFLPIIIAALADFNCVSATRFSEMFATVPPDR
mgnify:CR=1 FL=1